MEEPHSSFHSAATLEKLLINSDLLSAGMAWSTSAPSNLWAVPAPGHTAHSQWGQADPSPPTAFGLNRNLLINLIIQHCVSTGREKVAQRRWSREGSCSLAQPEGQGICLGRDTVRSWG